MKITNTTASDWLWKWCGPYAGGEDMVCTAWKYVGVADLQPPHGSSDHEYRMKGGVMT